MEAGIAKTLFKPSVTGKERLKANQIKSALGAGSRSKARKKRRDTTIHSVPPFFYPVSKHNFLSALRNEWRVFGILLEKQTRRIIGKYKNIDNHFKAGGIKVGSSIHGGGKNRQF